MVKSLPPNVNLKSEETQELLFQSLLAILLESSRKQTEVELTLQDLNEVLESGELQFKGSDTVTPYLAFLDRRTIILLSVIGNGRCLGTLSRCRGR